MKKFISAALCLVMVLGLAAFGAGCGEKSKIYAVSVVGGTGGGNYYENNICKATATVPDGKQFMKWTADGEDVCAAEEYIFKVTQDVDLVAVFGDFSNNVGKDVFTVKTIDGVGDGGYVSGSECTVKLLKSEVDRVFIGWTPVDSDGAAGEVVSTENPYKFTVTQNVTLKAQFSDIRLDTPYGTLCRISSTPAWGDVMIELDRVKDSGGNSLTGEDGKPLTMFDGRIQYIMIHLYDSPYSTVPVASFKFVQEADLDFGKFVTMDGSAEYTGIHGGPGNYYKDHISMGDFAPFMRAAVGESYSADTYYYIASQLIAKDEPVAWGEEGKTQLFADSKISGFNGEKFCEND